MDKKYTMHEEKVPSMVEEPATAYTQPVTMHVDLTYDIPQKIDVVTFRMMMDKYAMDIINATSNMDSVNKLRNRLVLAANDAKEGRTKSCEAVHESLENKFPWLCK